ncbi:hypothetical protein BaRGS_00031331 [Batillaria attramentaria]|uniref:Uncharacterized protein n=1 Tax=Batillaria attramentaria TaxID=370345 RepID=A0ABD0JS21_9CAEN
MTISLDNHFLSRVFTISEVPVQSPFSLLIILVLSMPAACKRSEWSLGTGACTKPTRVSLKRTLARDSAVTAVAVELRESVATLKVSLQGRRLCLFSLLILYLFPLR